MTKQKLEETKLEKTRDDLTNSVNYVATKLNCNLIYRKIRKHLHILNAFSITSAVEKQLAGLKIIDENLSTQLEGKSNVPFKNIHRKWEEHY